MAAIFGSGEGHRGNCAHYFPLWESRAPLEHTLFPLVALVTAWLSPRFTLASLPPAPLLPGDP